MDFSDRFAPVAMSPEKVDKAEKLRQLYNDLAAAIDWVSEDGREKSLAITHLEESSHWAIRSVALRG